METDQGRKHLNNLAQLSDYEISLGNLPVFLLRFSNGQQKLAYAKLDPNSSSGRTWELHFQNTDQEEDALIIKGVHLQDLIDGKIPTAAVINSQRQHILAEYKGSLKENEYLSKSWA